MKYAAWFVKRRFVIFSKSVTATFYRLGCMVGYTRAVFLAAMLISYPALSGRDRHMVMEFKRANPCPATGQSRGTCPGWIVDHIHPMCAGGEDAPHNMQWQTIEAAKIKDREEARQCAALRRERKQRI